jgi:hypothetical protein
MLRLLPVVAFACMCTAATSGPFRSTANSSTTDSRQADSPPAEPAGGGSVPDKNGRLRDVDALLQGTSVTLTWSTVAELGVRAFAVEHEVSGRYERVGVVDSKGDESSGFDYRLGIGFLSSGNHRFRILQIRSDGTTEELAGLDVSVGLPDEYFLTEAYPNPFNPRTTFGLTVRQRQHVSIELMSSLGRRVASIFEGEIAPNEERTFSIEAKGLSSGVYFYRVSGETFAATRLVALVK